MDSSFTVLEGVYLLDMVPTDAEILWQTSWHYAKYTVAYARELWPGTCILHYSWQRPQTLTHPSFNK